jgi:serine/threonine-protein kinase
MYRDDTANLHWRNADNTGIEERVSNSTRYQYATSWSQDHREVLYSECDGMGYVTCDIGRLTLNGKPGKLDTELVLETKANEYSPAHSPDGRWIAYESDRSGRFEIYVQPYPAIESGFWKISTDGGKQPLWSPDGKTLYYSAGSAMSRQMMSVDIEYEDGFKPGQPQRIFDFTHAVYLEIRNHALHPDGKRFLMVKPVSSGRDQRLVYVQNWLDEVERLVPTE